MSKIKALALFKDHSGCDYHRICLPFQYAASYVDNTAFEGCAGDLDKLLATAELIVFNREFPLQDQVNLEEARRKHGFKVVLDLDDYWDLYQHHYLFDTYRRYRTTEKIVQNIRMADAVTVTTTRLADKVREYNRDVHVIPNALPFGHGQFTPGRRPAEVFRFIYAGQKSHLHDLKLLQAPLQRLAEEQHRNIGFVLAGYNHHPGDQVATWPKMEGILSAGGTMPNYQRLNNLPLSRYMEVYQHGDASLVPLEDNVFNSCKSNLKLLEAGAHQIPAICQRVPPYSDCLNAPVLWVDNSNDWYKHIRYLADNLAVAQDLGSALHDWAVKNYSLFHWNNYRFDLYRQIVNC